MPKSRSDSLQVEEEKGEGNQNRSLNPMDESIIQEQSASRKFIEKIFQKQFPKIISVVLKYSNQIKIEYI